MRTLTLTLLNGSSGVSQHSWVDASMLGHHGANDPRSANGMTDAGGDAFGRRRPPDAALI